MRKLIILSLVTGCILMTGCATLIKPYRPPVQQGNIMTADMMKQLKVGMTKAQVANIFGSPVLDNPFAENTWTYVYTMQPSKGKSEKKILVVNFRNGKVVSFQQIPTVLPKP